EADLADAELGREDLRIGRDGRQIEPGEAADLLICVGEQVLPRADAHHAADQVQPRRMAWHLPVELVAPGEDDLTRFPYVCRHDDVHADREGALRDVEADDMRFGPRAG